MKKIIFLFVLFLCNNNLSAQQDDDASMIEYLIEDYFADTNKHVRQQKRDCYKRYCKFLLQSVHSMVYSPIMYLNYYYNREEITFLLQSYYDDHGLEDIENIGKDIVSGKIEKDSLKAFLGENNYRFWLYGDTKQPIENGGVPKDYKPNLPMFLRRYLYSAIRNPRWNATYIYNYSTNIDSIVVYKDSRNDVVTKNYGTCDTRLGKTLRWYIDDTGKWWFYYERTKMLSESKGTLFYFGGIGFGSREAGKVDKSNTKPTRFEFSLNRVVKLLNE